MYAIIPAAGLGSRMGQTDGGRTKVFFSIGGGKPVLALSVEALAASGVLEGIVIAARSEDSAEVEALLADSAPHLARYVVAGGATRQESVANGLRCIAELTPCPEYVMVHDGARPFCAPKIIAAAAAKAKETGAAIVALESTATVKRTEVDSSGNPVIVETIPREAVWLAQTPQVFATELLLRAHREAVAAGYIGTDEAALVERLGVRVAVVPGSPQNIKITTPEDLPVAAAIVAARAAEESG